MAYMAYILMAYILMAYVVMAYIVMTYVVMAYMIMASSLTAVLGESAQCCIGIYTCLDKCLHHMSPPHVSTHVHAHVCTPNPSKLETTLVPWARPSSVPPWCLGLGRAWCHRGALG